MEFYKIPGVSIAVINDFAIEWETGVGYLKAAIRLVWTRDRCSRRFGEQVRHGRPGTSFRGKGIAGSGRRCESISHFLKIPDNQITKVRKVTLRYLLSHQSGIPAQAQLEDSASVLQILSGERPAKNPPAGPIPSRAASELFEHRYVVIQLILEEVTKSRSTSWPRKSFSSRSA